MDPPVTLWLGYVEICLLNHIKAKSGKLPSILQQVNLSINAVVNTTKTLLFNRYARIIVRLLRPSKPLNF